MAFHVFVEGATDSSPAGISRLAEAIGRHYGLPGADLLARLQKGRFRVKGNTDRETADQYVRDLERLGAVCVVEEATAENSQRSTPLPFPAVRPATPPVGSATVPRSAGTTTPPAGSALPPRAAGTTTPPAGSALPPRAAGTTTPPTGSALPPRTAGTTTPPAGSALAALPPSRPSTPPPIAGFSSGLAAAFSGEQPVASLGVLESDAPAFALSSVDGNDSSGPVSAAAFEPPQGGLPASIGPAPDKPKETAAAAAAKAKAARPKDEPLDLFAPPDQQGEEFQVHIAADEVEKSARKRASTPPPTYTADGTAPSGEGSPARASQPQMRKSQPSLQVPNVPAVEGGVAVRSSSKLGPLGDERVRYVAGVLLAVVLGFVPAHIVAGMREESAFAEIDQKVIRAQQQADTPEAYELLDRMRADQLERKEAERRNAAIIAFVIWGVVGGGIAFAWFRKIPWDSFE